MYQFGHFRGSQIRYKMSSRFINPCVGCSSVKLEFFVDTYKPYISGVVTAVEMLAGHLRNHGHLVTINAPAYSDGPAESEPNVRRIPSIPFPGYEGLRIAAPLPFHLSTKEPFDLVHAHSPFPMGFAGLSLARERKVPLVFTCHSLYPDYSEYVPWASTTVRKVLEAHMQYFCNRCDAVIAPSNHIRRKLLNWGIEAPAHVVPTGIELEPFIRLNKQESRAWIIKRHRLPGKRFLLLFVGRLAQEKNLDYLLVELRRLKELCGGSEGGDFHLLLVGTGPHEDALRQRVERLRISDRVTFAGKVERERVVRYYRGADGFVFPSMAETQGIVLVEALAGGLPIVALSAPATREVVLNGIEGLLVPDESGTLEMALHQLISSRGLQAVFQDAALRRAEDFSIAGMISELERVYELVINTYDPSSSNSALTTFRRRLQGEQTLRSR